MFFQAEVSHIRRINIYYAGCFGCVGFCQIYACMITIEEVDLSFGKAGWFIASIAYFRSAAEFCCYFFDEFIDV